MDHESSGMLPAIIKYMELQYTLSLVNKKTPTFSNDLHACSNSFISGSNEEPMANLETIYKAIHKYLAPSEDQSFSQILSAVRTMKSVREMQQMMELFQSLNPDMDLGSTMENFASGGMNFNNMNLGNMNFNGMDLNELMKIFGGNGNGDKQ